MKFKEYYLSGQQINAIIFYVMITHGILAYVFSNHKWVNKTKNWVDISDAHLFKKIKDLNTLIKFNKCTMKVIFNNMKEKFLVLVKWYYN